jgi:hypothetical protein
MVRELVTTRRSEPSAITPNEPRKRHVEDQVSEEEDGENVDDPEQDVRQTLACQQNAGRVRGD